MNTSKYYLVVVLTVCGLTLGNSNSFASNGAIIFKTGNYTLSDDFQTLDATLTVIDLTIDEDSSGVFGIEAEWHTNNNFALGGELLRFKNDWVSDAPSTGDIDATLLMFSAKKYFDLTRWLHPYIGLGVGIAVADFEGPGGNAAAVDLAIQAKAGIEFFGEPVGLYTEVKSLSSKPEDSDGDEIDISGTGVFAGISIKF